ncbi:MAG: FAD binding domain-containing protein [Spirochaetales bacterium]|nr:FAD binding domain-containing protein [Spirochaetales bacterium]
MQKEVDFRKILTPGNVHELLTLFSEYPDSLLFAGGTWIMINYNDTPAGFPEYIIDCGGIEELQKIKRTERYLEIGALVPLSRILGISPHVIPPVLYSALSMTATPEIRRLATLGGNININSSYSGILTVLFAMDCILEIRSLQQSRWISISELFLKTNKKNNLIPKDSVLTRIRIPSANWDFQVFRKIARKKSLMHCSLTFCGLAKTNKGILSDIRLCFGALGNQLFRQRGFEIKFLGRKLPFMNRTIDILLSEFGLLINPVTDRYSRAEYRRSTSIRLLKWFLEEINQMLL